MSEETLHGYEMVLQGQKPAGHRHHFGAAAMHTEVRHLQQHTSSLGAGADNSGGGAVGLSGGVGVGQTHVGASIANNTQALVAAAIARKNQETGQLIAASIAPAAARMGRPAKIGSALESVIQATTPVAPAAAAPAVDGTATAATAEEAPVTYKANEFFPQEAIKVAPFRVKFATSLADQASGREPAVFERDLTYNSNVKLEKGQQVMVIAFEVTQKNCSSAAEMGVRCGNLGNTRVSALDNKPGMEYHIELPQLAQAVRKPETVISSEMMGLNPTHLRRYAGRTCVDDLRAEIAPDRISSSIVHVPLETPIGDALSLPNFENPRVTNAQHHNATKNVAEDGTEFYTLKTEAVEKLLKIIGDNVFGNPEFHWRQTALDKFQFTLVPLTESEQFVASEMGVEDYERQAAEMNRRFTVTLCGNVHFVPLPVAK